VATRALAHLQLPECWHTIKFGLGDDLVRLFTAEKPPKGTRRSWKVPDSKKSKSSGSRRILSREARLEAFKKQVFKNLQQFKDKDGIHFGKRVIIASAGK
jgi:hypothetical protein